MPTLAVGMVHNLRLNPSQDFKIGSCPRNPQMRLVLVFIVVSCSHSTIAIGGETSSDRGISGKVVDSDGRPVPNADVYCSAYVYDRFPTVTGRSGTDGAFTITVPPADEFVSASDRLWVFAPGYSVTACAIPESKKEMISLRVVLRPPSDFCMKVTLPSGKPAQNALVLVPALGLKTERCKILNGEHFFPPEALVKRTAATTDRQGVAVMPAWNYQEALRVDVIAPSFGRQTCYSRWIAGLQPKTWNINLLTFAWSMNLITGVVWRGRKRTEGRFGRNAGFLGSRGHYRTGGQCCQE